MLPSGVHGGRAAVCARVEMPPGTASAKLLEPACAVCHHASQEDVLTLPGRSTAPSARVRSATPCHAPHSAPVTLSGLEQGGLLSLGQVTV